MIASQVCIAIVNDPPTPLDMVMPSLDPGLVRVIHQCLEKDREKRPANVGELAQMLAPFGSSEGRMHAQRALRVCKGRGASIPDSDRPPPSSVRKPVSVRPPVASAETLPAMTSSAPAPRRSRAAWFVVAGALLVGAIAVVVMVRRSTSTSGVTPTVDPSPSVTAAIASSATVAVPTVAASTSSVPVASATPSVGAPNVGKPGSTIATARPTASHPAPNAVHSGVVHPNDGTEDRN